MKNILTLVLVALCTFVLQGQTSDNTIYSFKVKDLYGKVFDRKKWDVREGDFSQDSPRHS